MKYVVAVSGGVDSMVLLDMLVRQSRHELIVAHFDHGIRDDSRRDAQLVERAAKQYGLPFESRREELGKGASEELARERRYAFLRSVAKKHNAIIVTAHHLDDLVESVAINLLRGTGWRGLAVLASDDIHRPLIDEDKKELREYARTWGIRWREDSTNTNEEYLRNRIRKRTQGLSDDKKRQLRALQARQVELRKEIDEEVARLVGGGPSYSRYFFTHLPEEVAVECLRHVTRAQLTRPQRKRLLHAIKVAQPGSVFQAGNGIQVQFSTRQFSL